MRERTGVPVSRRKHCSQVRQSKGTSLSRYADKEHYASAYSRLLVFAFVGPESDLPTGPCWLIRGVWLSTSGHSKVGIKIGGKWRTISGHRLSWMIHEGRTERHLCHLCDRKNCINPGHLYAGTRSQNMKDAVASGFIPAHTLFNAERNKRRAAERKAALEECPF